MTIGAQLYTVREFLKTPEAIATSLQRVAAIGYKTVHCSKLGPIDPHRLRALLDENGLTCVITHIDPERLLKDPDGVIAEHRVLGCDDIGMSIMPERYRGSLQGLQALVRDYRPIVARIRDAGLRFHYHNHDVELIRQGGQTLLDMLLEALPDAHLLLCAFWLQVGGGDPIDWIRRYSGRIRVAHLKDMAVCPGATGVGKSRMMKPVLEGNMNYRGIIDACREAGVSHLMVEQDECEGDPFDALAVSFRNLSALGLC